MAFERFMGDEELSTLKIPSNRGYREVHAEVWDSRD
jgi:hypothetical protein